MASLARGIPITEMPNEITKNIDVSTPIEIVRLLQQVDAQIFSGWGGHEGVYECGTVATMERVIECACELLHDPAHNAVVLSGCGTSGRLAFITARTFNHHLSTLGLPPCYHYIVAGGDSALVKSVEATEDSWRKGVRALEETVQGKRAILFVGITCGLSAPFVAGQLDHCLQYRERYIPVLLGFNQEALSTPINDWDKTFFDVAQQMREQKQNSFILNPVVGPEGITGSTRMKGGTATKMILDTIFSAVHCRLARKNTSPIVSLLQSYELTYRHTYFESIAIATILKTAAQCLCAGGHVYYLGVGSLGLMALLDASECPPTFGAAFVDVRGFVRGGYDTLGNLEGDISHKGMEYCLSWKDFASTTLPHLTVLDCVIFVMKTTVSIYKIEEAGAFVTEKSAEHKGISHSLVDTCLNDYAILFSEVRQLCDRLAGSRKCCILVGTSQDHTVQVDHGLFDCHVQVVLPWQPLSYYWWCADQSNLLLEAAVKWVLNAVSTGAHVLRGKVLNNKMVDLRVSNSKLFRRAIGIVQDFSGVTPEKALQCLLSVIHDDPDHTHLPVTADLTQHIQVATAKAKVVPAALLVSTGSYTAEEAHLALEQNPIIRNVLAANRT